MHPWSLIHVIRIDHFKKAPFFASKWLVKTLDIMEELTVTGLVCRKISFFHVGQRYRTNAPFVFVVIKGLMRFGIDFGLQTNLACHPVKWVLSERKLGYWEIGKTAVNNLYFTRRKLNFSNFAKCVPLWRYLHSSLLTSHFGLCDLKLGAVLGVWTQFHCEQGHLYLFSASPFHNV